MRIFVFLLVSLFCGCIHQAPPTIAIPQTPRVVIKEVPAIKNQQTAEESFSRPNLTRGYIENQAFPYVPRVWLIRGGKKILLVGQTEKGPPQVLDWQILEFDLPPDINHIIVERWRYLSPQIGWQMLPPESCKLQVAKPRRGGYWDNNQYDWQIIIRQDRSYIYEGGQTGWGHGRRGW